MASVTTSGGLGSGSGGRSGEGISKVATPTVPLHSLAAFGLFLRLPGYADVLLKDKQKAQCLLRLVLGVTDDGEGGKFIFYFIYLFTFLCTQHYLKCVRSTVAMVTIRKTRSLQITKRVIHYVHFNDGVVIFRGLQL